jgi:hypothetical protein
VRWMGQQGRLAVRGDACSGGQSDRKSCRTTEAALAPPAPSHAAQCAPYRRHSRRVHRTRRTAPAPLHAAASTIQQTGAGTASSTSHATCESARRMRLTVARQCDTRRCTSRTPHRATPCSAVSPPPWCGIRPAVAPARTCTARQICLFRITSSCAIAASSVPAAIFIRCASTCMRSRNGARVVLEGATGYSRVLYGTQGAPVRHLRIRCVSTCAREPRRRVRRYVRWHGALRPWCIAAMVRMKHCTCDGSGVMRVPTYATRSWCAFPLTLHALVSVHTHAKGSRARSHLRYTLWCASDGGVPCAL